MVVCYARRCDYQPKMKVYVIKGAYAHRLHNVHYVFTLISRWQQVAYAQWGGARLGWNIFQSNSSPPYSEHLSLGRSPQRKPVLVLWSGVVLVRILIEVLSVSVPGSLSCYDSLKKQVAYSVKIESVSGIPPR